MIRLIEKGLMFGNLVAVDTPALVDGLYREIFLSTVVEPDAGCHFGGKGRSR